MVTATPARGNRWPWVAAPIDTFTRFERVAYGSLIEPHHSSRRAAMRDADKATAEETRS